MYCGKEHIGTKTCPERRDKFSGSRERELIGSGKRERARERQREREARDRGVCSYETYKFPGFSGFRTTTLPTFLESEGEREGDRASVCVWV